MSIDLSTRIGNLELRSPLIVGSCPMTTDEMHRISMICNGVGAIVLPSFHVGRNESEFEYLNQLSSIASQDEVPVFGSVRVCMESQDWFDLPAKLEAAGAAAIELGIIGCNAEVDDPRKYEDDLVALVERAHNSIDIPLILKLNRRFTSISDLARRIRPSVRGLILFGRMPVLDIELDSLTFSRSWGLTQSGSVVANLEPIIRMRKAIPQMPLIACGGIGNSEDLIKSILAGANAAMVTSAIYRNGTATLGVLKDGLIKFMNDHGVSNLDELRALCPSLDDSLLLSQAEFHQDVVNEPHFAARKSESKSDRFGHVVD